MGYRMEMGLGFVSESGVSSADSPTESLNGLKFGQKIYFEDTAAPSGTGAPPKSGAVSLPSGSGKKLRVGAVAQSGQCQVEGCKADLSDAKAYYSRHKVCGMHSKTPKVIVAGVEQRFCQQCSRFHLLSEFDQGKRSCRRRLAGHNERRRKPPPGSLLSSRCSKITSSIIAENSSRSGGVMLYFTAYSKLAGRDAWPVVRPMDRLPVNNSSATGRVHSHLWQDTFENPAPHILFQSSPGDTNLSDPVIPPGECFTDSTRARSLLSNQLPWATRNRDSSVGIDNVISALGATMAQTTAPPGAAVMNTTWGLIKGNDSTNCSGMLPPNVGSGQLSQPVRGLFSGELESSQQRRRQYMELEDSRAYDSSTQHIHWSL